jgi:endonuclease YncB( thermonuclease family)
MRAAVLLALLASACTIEPAPAPTNELSAKARAIDGDTVSISFRLLGTDALESRQRCQRDGQCHACGKEAQDYAARLLRAGNATIARTGAMTYGRPVATVAVDGRDLGEQMIAAGLAIPLYDFLKADPARATAYRQAFDEAVRTRHGMHAGEWIAPADWRHGKRLPCERRRRFES